MILYATTVFLSAFLLFQVQPLIGKYILPWFGGTSSVWTTSLLFFQVALLVGYAYAHLIVSRLSSRAQGTLHLALLAAALLALPITPSEGWKPGPADDPTWRILALLTVSIGAPYLLLSSTGPLLQGWFSRTHPGRSPYRLYALSNAGSLLALLSYPVVFERLLGLQTQTRVWSIGYVLFAAVCGTVAWRLLRAPPVATAGAPSAGPPVGARASGGRVDRERDGGEERSPGRLDAVFWLALSAAGSTMLLATTNVITQDVAVVPFLWVLPLSLYLLTFIITFDNERWYDRMFFTLMLVVAATAVIYAIDVGVELSLLAQVGIFSGALFFVCMSCHGELVKLRPGPSHLTLFYLMVAAGGALGGVLVAVVAPLVFDGLWEYHSGLFGASVLVAVVIGRDQLRRRREQPARAGTPWQRLSAAAVVLAAVGGLFSLGWLLNEDVERAHANVITMERNFYGVLRVLDALPDDPAQRRIELVNGAILHGFQYQAPEKSGWPTTYYGPESGVSIALDQHPTRRTAASPLRIGVVGLGTGTIAVSAGAGDYLRFYEINPTVVELSREYFTFVSDAVARGADVDIFLGDARIVMERQRERGELQRFDVLAIDAFNSDAIPVHLLTEEAFDVYLDHLKPDGILAVHVTNRHLDLTPVVRKLAEVNGMEARLFRDESDGSRGIYRADWVLVTANRSFLDADAVASAGIPWPDDAPQPLLWTDDYSNLLRVLK